MIDSVRSLARSLGVAQSVVRRYVARDDWPFGDPPWPADVIDRINAWRDTAMPQRAVRGLSAGVVAAGKPQDDAAPETLHSATLRVKRAQANRLEFDLAVTRGEYVLRADVEADIRRRIIRCREALLHIGRQLAPRLVGLDERDIESMIYERIHAALTELGRVPCETDAGTIA